MKFLLTSLISFVVFSTPREYHKSLRKILKEYRNTHSYLISKLQACLNLVCGLYIIVLVIFILSRVPEKNTFYSCSFQQEFAKTIKNNL